jgi:hypothetical protein
LCGGELWLGGVDGWLGGVDMIMKVGKIGMAGAAHDLRPEAVMIDPKKSPRSHFLLQKRKIITKKKDCNKIRVTILVVFGYWCNFVTTLYLKKLKPKTNHPYYAENWFNNEVVKGKVWVCSGKCCAVFGNFKRTGKHV